MQSTVYIFRGAPASGKSTVVPKFCDLLPKPVALISQDILRWGFHLIGRSVSEVQEEEHLFAYKNTLVIYEEYLRSRRYTIVLEGLFTWNDVNSSQRSVRLLSELASQYGYSIKSIVLKANKEELLERNAQRAYAVPPEEFDMLYASIYEIIDSSELVIDSSKQNLNETIKLLRQRVLGD